MIWVTTVVEELVGKIRQLREDGAVGPSFTLGLGPSNFTSRSLTKTFAETLVARMGVEIENFLE